MLLNCAREEPSPACSCCGARPKQDGRRDRRDRREEGEADIAARAAASRGLVPPYVAALPPGATARTPSRVSRSNTATRLCNDRKRRSDRWLGLVEEVNLVP